MNYNCGASHDAEEIGYAKCEPTNAENIKIYCNCMECTYVHMGVLSLVVGGGVEHIWKILYSTENYP